MIMMVIIISELSKRNINAKTAIQIALHKLIELERTHFTSSAFVECPSTLTNYPSTISLSDNSTNECDIVQTRMKVTHYVVHQLLADEMALPSY